jgi:hypothetical protein
MRAAVRLLAVLLLAGAGRAAFAQDGAPAAGQGGLDIGGSLLSDASVLQTVVESPAGAAPGGFSQLALNVVNRNRQSAKVEGTAIFSLWYGAYAGTAAAQAAAAGLFASPPGPGGAVATLEVRKLYLAIFTPVVDISMGRQIINFGVGTLFSPIDAFSVPLLSDLNYVRTGSDVVRLDAPFNDVSGVEAVSTVSGSFDSLSSALKLYTNVLDVDLAAVGIYRGARKEALAGLSFKGDLEVGLYGEAVEHFVYSPQQTYFEGMLGADYSIEKTWFFTLEYSSHGNPLPPGSAAPADASTSLFLNQHYLYAMIRWQFTELAGISASLIWDISASVLLPTIQVTYNIAQNANVMMYGRYFGGDIRSGAPWPGPDFQWGVEAQVSF